ncbi:FecR family protein [Mangrovibacterium diazotrophicum]|uniref:FecR family protein n=1 Tax=Mangrovibacterium diazotrophicum TaxID=1261403 RepID=A0A419W9T1_9BACT|nr:FecR domain-containing protein [Mangrovibacterium diazotrophicum]RKD92228.1 FecR family protein [Mangrovibacterium diazotrophicum]
METNRNNTDEKWAALAKHLFDEPTAENSESLAADWDEDELKDIRETARQVDLYFQQKRFSAKEAFTKIDVARNQAATLKPKKTIQFWSRIAAVVAIALFLGGAGYWMSGRNGFNTQKEIASGQNADITEIVLADGSVVTLNYGSTLTYPDEFNGKYREVTLDGEGFFEVQPNPEQPFIIHAGKADIQVLGTSFNVNAYPQNGEVSVVVQTGRVRVSSNELTETGEKVVLIPGEKGVLALNDQVVQKSQNTDVNFLSWKTHSFSFNKTSLKDVIQQLDKVYRVQISTADPDLERLLLTARFDDRPVRFILEVIAMTHGLEIQQTNENEYLLQKN